jgi:hypothetical protein
MSMVLLRWRVAVAKRAESAGQDVTSVFWKTAFPWPGGGAEWADTRAWASGRRVRSARRTLQPRERRSAVKARFMPGKGEYGVGVVDRGREGKGFGGGT